jgi:PKD repeat protein
MYHGGSFADIDEDGKPEIVIGCYDNHVYVFNGEDGSLSWEYIAPYYIAAPTSIADLNNDNHYEIVFASYNMVGVLSYTGDLLLDVVFGSDDGILRALKGNDGQIVWSYNLESHYGNTFNIDHAPVIADFDNNGELDVFVVGGYGTSSPSTNNHGRAYVLSAGGGTGSGWKMFRFDVRHSACFEDEENQIPIAFFDWYPTRPCVNKNIIFNASESYDPDGNIIHFQWDWDDDGIYDEIVNDPIIYHNWTNTGNYTISLKVVDNHGGETSVERIVNIFNNVNPTADFFFIPDNPSTLDVVEFNDLSYDEEGSIIEWYWDFGDGNTSFINNPINQYGDDGEYLVTLTVIDDSDLNNSISKLITIENTPPNSFIDSINPNPTFFGINVSFQGYGEDYDGIITSYEWNSDIDGQLYIGSNPVFIKNSLSIGEHIISLRVRDDDFEWSNWTNEILIINEYSDNSPPNIPILVGMTNCKIGVGYEYCIENATDPDNDTLYVIWEWGDNNQSSWKGPYQPGEDICDIHSWDNEGLYIIKAKLRDSKGAESDWGILEVSIPKGKDFSLFRIFFDFLVENFPIFADLFYLFK